LRSKSQKGSPPNQGRVSVLLSEVGDVAALLLSLDGKGARCWSGAGVMELSVHG